MAQPWILPAQHCLMWQFPNCHCFLYHSTNQFIWFYCVSVTPQRNHRVVGVSNEILQGPWVIDPQLYNIFINKLEENTKTLFDKNVKWLTKIRRMVNNEVEKVLIQSNLIRSTQSKHYVLHSTATEWALNPY